MRSRFNEVVGSICLFLFCTMSAQAAVPSFVTYSGRLTDGTGWGESAEETLVFNLYNTGDPQAAPFWYTTHDIVPVVDGYFTVNLGMCPQDGGPCVTNPADATFPGDLPGQMWVGVEVGGVELAPRQAVGSVPYAMRAGRAVSCDDAESLEGRICGGVACPVLDGYTLTCNLKQHCEYANEDDSGWRQWDVWVYVPPGMFWMGSTGEAGGADETPVHGVTIGYGYFISKYEIVVEQYEACMADGGTCPAPSTADWDGNGWGTNSSSNHGSDHPQNGLTWQQAKDFCAWVAPEGRLPSESEWEYAATGSVHMKYPWGNLPDPTCSNNTAVFNEAGGTGGYGCGTGGTWPVGSKPAGASWCGALDMSGNLWEWCEDWYHSSYTGAPADGSAWVDPTGSHRVRRGGGFYSGAAVDMRSAERSNDAPGSRHAGLGARCLRPIEP